MGIVRSAPLTARCAPPFMERSSFRKFLTSWRATISCRVCMGRASNARCSLGSARILMFIILFLLLLSVSSIITVSSAGGSSVGAASSMPLSSSSSLSIAAAHSSFALSNALFSASYLATSSSTAFCCSSSVASVTSAIAASSSVSRFLKAASLPRSCSNSFFLLSMLLRSIRALSAITYFLL